MKVSDIKKACNSILLTALPNCKVYGNDTKDGYIRPSFFTEIIPRSYRPVSKAAVSAGYTYKATLLETTHDEAFCLDVIDLVREAFGTTIKCGNMHLLVEEIEWDWIDNGNDVLQLSIDFAEFVVIRNIRSKQGSEDYDRMETLDLDIYIKPSNGEFADIMRRIRDGAITFRITENGRLIARRADLEDYVNFDIAEGRLSASIVERISEVVTFYIDGTGHLFARYGTPSGIEETFNVYVTKGE